jgi:hypothetical protein
MKIFKLKPNEAELTDLQTAAVNLKSANQRLAAAQKDVDNAKLIIRHWLVVHRNIYIDTLPTGDIIQIEGVCIVQRDRQHKFDEAAFSIAHPDIYTTWKRDFPVNRFKPLV